MSSSISRPWPTLFAPVLTGESSASQVVAISGTAGVGKTALALEWARRVRHVFDGDLYVHLRGHTDRGSARSAADVLPFLLRALDVPPDAVSARYRVSSLIGIARHVHCPSLDEIRHAGEPAETPR